MKYLIDRHVFIWAVSDYEKLSDKAKEVILDIENEIFVSAISFWEISLKVQIGKFNLTGFDIKKAIEYTQKLSCKILKLGEIETSTFSELASFENHRDPFDRMIIWQSIVNDMVLISKDKLFEQYKKNRLKLIW
jgi:PIN domain nuclease of toxin-antitoxin system